MEQATEHQFGDDADDPGEDRGDHHGPHVPVDDVGQFMGQNRFELVAGQGFDKTAGDRDAVLAFMQARSEGVQAVIVDDAKRRRPQTAGDRKVFQQVVDLRFGFSLNLPGTGHHVDHGLTPEIGDGEPDPGYDDGERDGAAQPGRGKGHVVAQPPARPGQDAEPHQHQLQSVDDQDHQDGKPGQQQDRTGVVCPDMGLEPDGTHQCDP